MKTTQYVRQERAISAADCELEAETSRLLKALDLGHLYVVEFNSGIVKVGKAVDPRVRIGRHAANAQAHGGGVRASWTSKRHCGYHQTEQELIDFCSRAGTAVVGKEYFRISFNRARARAGLLASTRLDESGLSVAWQEAVALDEQRRLALIPHRSAA